MKKNHIYLVSIKARLKKHVFFVLLWADKQIYILVLQMSIDKEFEYENELSIDSKLLCSICLNPFLQPKWTPCKHIFCSDCIELWLKKDSSCPICRQIIRKKKF